MAESIVTLRVEARNAISSLNKTSLATKQLSTNAKGATASLTSASAAAKGLGASLATSLGPLLTMGAAFATVGSAIGTFTARERDVAILRQGLVNLGEGTVALNELQVAADKLGNQTLFNQEEFTRGFNLLTSFRKIGVDSYERVAQAAADIAQVNQVDVNTSFMQLAKALQDPERNLSNLNRSGIAFTKTQTDVIKELMKTNKTAEAHAMILRIVEESYNKLSQAAAEGFAGNVDSLGEAFRDFSETLGKTLEPALIATTKGLTELLKATNAFMNSPIVEASAVIAGIALAAKGLPVLLTAVNLGFMKVAAAGGVLTIALNAIPFVAVATGIGAIVTKLIKQRKEQDKVTDAIKNGEKAQLDALAAGLKIKMAKEEAIINESNDKRSINAAKRRLALLEDELKPIKERLEIIIQENAEIDKTNKKLKDKKDLLDKNAEAAKKLKEKFDEIGKSVEQNLVQNLTDAVMGAQTLGQALSNVLRGIQRQLIEMAVQSAVGGIGGLFSSVLSAAFSGGGGGLASSAELGAQATAMTGIPSGADLLPGSFANGGNPPVGKASLVGEKGPELFVPQKSGTIIPNHALTGTTNVVVNVDASGSAVQGNDDSAAKLGEVIASAVQAEIVNQQMAGGLLS